MATRELAQWSHDLQYTRLPPEVINATIESFYNWAGCAIGGSNHEATTIAHKALSPFFGPPTASLLGTPSKLDAPNASLLNGISSHVHDYDDTHLDTIIHPTGPIASALLSLTEYLSSSSSTTPRQITGPEFLLALTIGIEISCKSGLALYPTHYNLGWHITSTTGSLGAAAACSKLLNLSPLQTQHAIGIASTQVTGLREMFGSHTKSFHVGRAAQNGLLAALLAQGGFEASETSVEGKRGWARVVGGWVGNGKGGLAPAKNDDQTNEKCGGDIVEASLRKWISGDSADVGLPGFTVPNSTGNKTGAPRKGRWELLRNSFKPFPCGIVVHPAIDACIQLHKEHFYPTTPSRSSITSIHLKVHHLVLELTGKKTPRDGLEAKFSVYHCAAAGLLLGKATPAEFEDNIVLDAEIISVRDRVTAEILDGCGADECFVTVKMADGRVLEKHVRHAVGSVQVPLDGVMLEEKFLGQCGAVLGVEGAKSASSALWKIEGNGDVAGLGKKLSL